ncbi:MAG: 2-hydroxyethylphosphonate methyltransferase [candidate division WS2 bacterium]|nr:2-hydroxyethylphosphonate methyltransferase [Candidatus Psychracetigena formicireducens]
MKIFLLNPPYVPEFMRSARWAAVSISGSNWYPIYLAYCTGLLEKYGHETKLVDGPVDRLSREDVFSIAKNFSPDISVLYISTVSLENDIKIGEKIKELTGSYIILVGPWCSIRSDEIIKKSDKIDSLAIGEFDHTILELAEGKPENKIDGLVWKNNGKIVHNPPRQPLTPEQLNDFPFVTDVYRRHLNIQNYFQAPHLHPFIDLFTGRGCSWGKCTFCLWPHTISKGAPYRTGDINKTIEELEFVKKKLPFVKEVFIQDDTLPAWRARELATAIIEAGLDITWSCYARSDATYDLEMLKLMKKSGCRCLHVGYESSSAQILKNIRKGTTPQIMEKFTEMTNKVGLVNHADFIIGLPGETVETIKESVKWAKTLKVGSYQFTVPKPYPETPFYEWLEENGCLKDGRANYPHLSAEDIDKWTKWALRQTNMNPKYLIRMIRKPKEWKRLIRSARYVVSNVVRK